MTGNGVGGMDELSPVAESFVAELAANGNITNSTLLPAEVGLRFRSPLEEISAGSDPHHEALRLLKVFTGRDKKGLYETICLNTAPIFYIANKVPSLKAGVEKARDIVDSGKAMDKLKQWVNAQNQDAANSAKRLDAFKKEI